MRHIARNQIMSISASSQDGNFPASNLLDGKPGRKWKAGGLVRNATIKMEVAGGVSDVALFGTNAREASATVEDPCAVTFGTNGFDNIVIDGTFSIGTGWTRGTGWTISGGKASSDGSQTTNSFLYRPATIGAGKTYRVQYTVSDYSAGTVKAYIGSNGVGRSRTSNGTFTEYITQVGTTTYFSIMADANFVGSVDNVSAFEMTSDELRGEDVLRNTTITTTATTTVDEAGNALRVNFNPAVPVPCLVYLNATSPGGETLYAGSAIAGVAETYGGANFRYGVGVSLNDYSITAQNSNASRYYKKRSIGKQYSLTALMLRTEADKLEATIRRDGAIASAWALFENSSEMIFGWPQLQRSMDHRLHDNIQLTLTEEI